MSLSMANDELERVVDFLERMDNGAESGHALNMGQGERTAWRDVRDEDDFHEAVSSLSGSTCTMPSAPAEVSAKTVVTDGHSGKDKQAPTESLSDVKKQEKRKVKAVPKVAAALPQLQQQEPSMTQAPKKEDKKAEQKNDKKPSTAAPPVRARLAERKPAQPQAANTDTATPDPAPTNAQEQQKGKGWFGLF